MSEHREEFLDLCAGYALDSLSDPDRARLEKHLDGGCSECEAALADFGAATVMLARSVPPSLPGRALRDRVLIAATSEGAGRPPRNIERRRKVIPFDRRSPGWFGWTAAVAAAALAMTTAVQWQSARDLRDTLVEERRWMEIAGAPGTRVADLELTPAGAAALRARATYDPKSKRAVIVFDNFKAPSGHDYELWAIRDAKPASLGLIVPDAAGHAVMRLENVGDPGSLQAFAVSLEPAGGAPTRDAPSGPVVMLGKLAS